jgi:hypothetical protein
MIHALIPSIVSDQLAPTHNFLRLRRWHWKLHGLTRLHCQTTRKKCQKWCDLRDRTAERNAETPVRVQSISPEAGGFPDEVYLEMWLVWERKYSARRYG